MSLIKCRKKMKDAQVYLKIILLSFLFYFFGLMLEITLPYLALKDDVAFLKIKKTALSYSWWQLAFYLHVFSSILTLLAGFTQFSPFFIAQFQSKVHQYMGRGYILVVLLVAAPSGFVLGLMANGGVYAKLAFVLLSLFWWSTTAAAYHYARKKVWNLHAAFMLRSFALTLSAITLRAWKLLLVSILAPAPMDLYCAVAWLAWVPNLLIVELYIQHKRGKDLSDD